MLKELEMSSPPDTPSIKSRFRQVLVSWTSLAGKGVLLGACFAVGLNITNNIAPPAQAFFGTGGIVHDPTNYIKIVSQLAQLSRMVRQGDFANAVAQLGLEAVGEGETFKQLMGAGKDVLAVARNTQAVVRDVQGVVRDVNDIADLPQNLKAGMGGISHAFQTQGTNYAVQYLAAQGLDPGLMPAGWDGWFGNQGWAPLASPVRVRNIISNSLLIPQGSTYVQQQAYFTRLKGFRQRAYIEALASALHHQVSSAQVGDRLDAMTKDVEAHSGNERQQLTLLIKAVMQNTEELAAQRHLMATMAVANASAYTASEELIPEQPTTPSGSSNTGSTTGQQGTGNP